VEEHPHREYQSVMRKEEQSPIRLTYDRRNRDLDPQLVWRGKDEQDWSELMVQALPNKKLIEKAT
jgi:adenine-specific DNA-methyltransferase